MQIFVIFFAPENMKKRPQSRPTYNRPNIISSVLP
jgi:hypothetical protein